MFATERREPAWLVTEIVKKIRHCPSSIIFSRASRLLSIEMKTFSLPIAAARETGGFSFHSECGAYA